MASREVASSENEHNMVTVEGEGTSVLFAQIAGLIARRIVCYKKLGDQVAKGERVGLIKFGSRVDVFLGPEWEIAVEAGRARLGRLQHSGATEAGLRTDGKPAAGSNDSIDPRSPARRPRRAAYALPTLFTAGNIFLGFVAILRSIEGALLGATGELGSNPHFEVAAIAIGVAVVLDGLDGRIARMTNTVSDFGREMDSLADVITFGIAPAVLAFTWGVQFVTGRRAIMPDHRAGYFFAFLFLLCGAARLARFNVQTNPIPKNPGRPDRKYFVGLPIPAAAAMVAAIVYASDSCRCESWIFSVLWLALLALLSFLMVSTWRYPSFKDFNLSRPRSPLTLILFGALIYLIWNFSQPVLLALSSLYVATGIAIRAGGIIRRRFRPHPPPPQPEHQAS